MQSGIIEPIALNSAKRVRSVVGRILTSLGAELIKGIRICKQAYAKYEEDFIERSDPNGKKYFWLTGEFVNFDKARDTDVWALEHNYVSVVPVQFDLTNYTLKSKLEKSWKF